MLDLIRRDPAVRALPVWLLVAPLTASAIEGARTILSIRGNDAAEPLLGVLALWFPVAIFLAFGRTRLRCHRFELTLPLRAQRLWLAHLVGVVLSGLAILAASAVVVTLRDRLVSRLPGSPTVPESIAHLLLPVACSLILAVVVLQAPSPALHRIPLGKSYVALAAACLVGALGVAFALAALPLPWVLVPLVIAAAWGLRIYRVLPPALAMLPRTAASAARVSPPAADGWSGEETAPAPRGALAGLRVYGTILAIFNHGIAPGQILKLPVTLAIGWPMFVIWGAFVSGAAFPSEPSIWIALLLLTPFLLFSMLAAPMTQFPVIDPLPVSRRIVFALLILPGLAMLALGYGAGRASITLLREPVESIEYLEWNSHYFLRVPKEFHRIGRAGALPDNVSPWGESQEPLSNPLFHGSRIVLYSPFSTAEGSSAEFVALQISRAVEAVYGRTIPPEEIHARYLVTGADGIVRPQGDGFPLLADYPDLRRRPAAPLLPGFLALSGLILVLLTAIYLRAFRAHRSVRFRMTVFYGLLGITLTLHLLATGLFMTRWCRPTVLNGFVTALLQRVVETVPGGTFLIWLVCALVFAAGYLVAQAQFARVEVPPERAQPAE